MHPRFTGFGPVLLAVLFAALLSGCQTLLSSAPKPSARIIGVNLQNLTLEKIDLVFNVEITNPYDVSLPLAELTYSISSAGKQVLQGGVQPNGAIPAHGTQVIQLPAIVQFASLAKVLGNVRPGSVVPYKADLALGVDAPVVGRLSLPLTKSGEVPVPAVPEVELTAFDISALSLDEVKAVAKLRVKNTNQFPLDLSKLGFAFGLGGKEIGRTNLANATSLAPGQIATLEIPISFAPRKFGAGLLNLLRGNQIAYQLNGSIEANSRFGPISLPFSRIGNTPVSR